MVNAIIGIRVALLFAVVQAARRMSYANSLKNGVSCMGLAVLLAAGGTQITVCGQDILPDKWRPELPPHDDNLTERVYVDPAVPPVASPKQAATGFIAYRRSYLELIFANTKPRDGEQIEVLDVRACPGEYEPITLSLYALRDLEKVSVSVTDLTRANDSAVLLGSTFDVRVVRSAFKRITHYTGPGEFMYMPTWLSAQPTVDVPSGQSRRIWITVHIPENAKPGKYEGTVTVRVQGDVRAKIPLSVEVLPIELVQPTGYAIGFYDPSANEKFWSLAERFGQMRSHGMTSVGLCADSGLKLAVVEGHLQVDFDGSKLERTMDAYRDAGFTEPILWLATGDVYKWCEKQADGDQHRFDELYVGVHQAILAEAKTHKWPEIVIQPEDECSNHPAKWRRAIRMLPLLKLAGFRTEMNSLFAYYQSEENRRFRDQVIPHTDILTHGYSVNNLWGCMPWVEMTERTIELDKTAWSYNMNDAEMVVAPSANRWMRGFFFRSLGAKYTGNFVWGYCYSYGDPHNDVDGGNADWLYYYPPDPERGLTGGPSIDYECSREGIDDLRYVLTLERLLDKARSSDDPAVRAQAEAGQKILDKISGSFDFNQMKQQNARWIECVWQTLDEQNGMRTATGSYTMPNGWSCQDYDLARTQIIHAILRLQSILD